MTSHPPDQPDRQAPYNLEAEQAILGAILINNDALDRVSGFLEASHFYDKLHQRIYETACKLIAGGKRADIITLKHAVANLEPIDATTTVPQYLGRLVANAATIINARDYGRTVHDLAVRRGLILLGEDMVNAAYDSLIDFPPREQIEEAETRLYALAERGTHGGGEITAADMHATAVAAMEKASENKGAVGLSTGFKDLDAKLGRLQPSDLIILAGRPSMGKTALATNIIRHNATTPTHFFSLEMSADQISQRLLSEDTGIPTERLRNGDLGEEEWRQVFAARDRLSKQPLLTDPTGAISIGQLAARARRVKRQHGTKLIVIDYLQLMRGVSKRADNRVQEVSEITTGLKALAKELSVPVIALSQLSRNVEHRTDKRPQLSDLRESGSIEQDADIVMFVYREGYYLERDKPGLDDPAFAGWTVKMSAVAGKAEVIIGKQRHGPIGTVPLQFDGTCTRFSNLAHSNQASACARHSQNTRAEKAA